MKYPIANGKIVERATVYTGPRFGTRINICNDSNVYSCSSGKVLGTINREFGGREIMISSSNDTFYTYSMLDTILVKKGQQVNVGDILGMKKKNIYDVYFIVFDVSTGPGKRSRQLNAENYTISK
jgi:murein DD-endopeptidase MepM/ murein hydrolase activator NlpD